MEHVTSSASQEGFAQIFHLSTNSVPAQDRIGIWNEFLHSRFLSLELEFLTDNTSFRSNGVRFPCLGIVAGDTAPQRITRTTRNTGDGNDTVRLVLLRRTSGPALVTQGRSEATVGPGEAFFVSNAEGHMAVYPERQHIVSLLLKRTALAPLLRNVDSAFVRPIPRQTDALGLLLAYADTLLMRPPATPELCHIAVGHVYDLAALAPGATRDAAHAAKARGLRTARLNAVSRQSS